MVRIDHWEYQIHRQGFASVLILPQFSPWRQGTFDSNRNLIGGLIPPSCDGIQTVSTDGVIEAIDGNLQPFGEQRLLAMLNCNVHESPAGIKERVLEALDDFTGKDFGHDDVTFMAVEII